MWLTNRVYSIQIPPQIGILSTSKQGGSSSGQTTIGRATRPLLETWQGFHPWRTQLGHWLERKNLLLPPLCTCSEWQSLDRPEMQPGEDRLRSQCIPFLSHPLPHPHDSRVRKEMRSLVWPRKVCPNSDVPNFVVYFPCYISNGLVWSNGIAWTPFVPCPSIKNCVSRLKRQQSNKSLKHQPFLCQKVPVPPKGDGSIWIAREF